MLDAIVVGHAVATVKDPSLEGVPLMLCQFLDADGNPADKCPVADIDTIGAGLGQRVVVSTDGGRAKALLGFERAPVRMFIQCLVDEPTEEAENEEPFTLSYT